MAPSRSGDDPGASVDPHKLQAALVGIDAAPRADDGTILPATFTPDTDEHRLMAELPRLERTDSFHDLELGETIGEGGMGLVRVAEQLAIGRRVAVKTLRPELDDPALALRLLREAWVTGALEHPNIIPIYSVGVDADGRPMIVMKRVEGTPWTRYIRDGTRELRWHLGILRQVASAIDFAGARGIIHRDLKPDNVMIGSFGEVYVLDWGIAVSLSGDHGGRLQVAQDVRGVAGTPGYMAPEMVRETGAELSVRTDVYLLGAVLHELITKQKRHRGEHLQAVLLASLASAPHEYEAHIPTELAELANRATHRDPDQRHPTAGAFEKAIGLFLEREGSRELVAQAEQRLAAWDELEDTEDRPDPVLVQNLFGEARFALQQALRQWPENERARDDLRRCLEKKFEHDLVRDDFESAAVVMAELEARRADQEQRLSALRARMEKRKAELGELRKLQANRDLDVGRRTRAFLMLVSAVSFGLIPPGALLFQKLGLPHGYEYFYVTSAVKLINGAVLAVWARESLTKTQVNVQLTATVFLLIIFEIAIRPFAQRLGHPIEHSLMIDFGLYFLVMATLAITVDRRLAWNPLFYFVGAVLSYFSVENVYWFLGASHFASGIFTAIVWRPEVLLGPDAPARAQLQPR